MLISLVFVFGFHAADFERLSGSNESLFWHKFVLRIVGKISLK